MYLIHKVFRPELYQGKYKKKNYFEGWYYKLIAKDRRHSLALIPGISLGSREADHHAFIQVIDGTSCQVDYFRFDMDEFQFDEERFWIRIGDSWFSDEALTLDLEQNGRRLEGKLVFSGIRKLERSLSWPGIMGPFSFVPIMECYHAIVNVHHELTGSLVLDGENWNFTRGYGYVEKDWGRSFPEAWIWLQCNHFDEPGVSLMFSVAKIPLLGRYFMGFISFLWVGERAYRFATYTRARITDFRYEDGVLRTTVEDKQFRLAIHAEQGPGGLLKAPVRGGMTGHVYESISARVQVTLSNREDRVLFEGQGVQAGMEVVEAILSYLSA